MKALRKTGIAVLVIAGVMLTSGYSYGQGVGNLGALPSVFPGDPAVGGWFIGQYPVERDPNGPAWIKNLTNPNGGNIIAQPGQMFTVQESLIISGSLPWSDWHEQILTPGWDWAPPAVLLANGAVAPGLTISHTPGSPTSGGAIDFYFNSLPVGTKVDIRKQLQYLGGATGAPFDGIVRIAEYPTPEPAALGLMLLGSLALWRRRRHATGG